MPIERDDFTPLEKELFDYLKDIKYLFASAEITSIDHQYLLDNHEEYSGLIKAGNFAELVVRLYADAYMLASVNGFNREKVNTRGRKVVDSVARLLALANELGKQLPRDQSPQMEDELMVLSAAESRYAFYLKFADSNNLGKSKDLLSIGVNADIKEHVKDLNSLKKRIVRHSQRSLEMDGFIQRLRIQSQGQEPGPTSFHTRFKEIVNSRIDKHPGRAIFITKIK